MQSILFTDFFEKVFMVPEQNLLAFTSISQKSTSFCVPEADRFFSCFQNSQKQNNQKNLKFF
jgi:hypothetical protein